MYNTDNVVSTRQLNCSGGNCNSANEDAISTAGESGAGAVNVNVIFDSGNNFSRSNYLPYYEERPVVQPSVVQPQILQPSVFTNEYNYQSDVQVPEGEIVQTEQGVVYIPGGNRRVSQVRQPTVVQNPPRTCIEYFYPQFS